MPSSRTLVFLLLVGFYGLTLLSLVATAQPAAPGAALSPGARAPAANPSIPPTVCYRTVEFDGMGPHLLDTCHFVLEKDGAVVARLMRGFHASHVPVDN